MTKKFTKKEVRLVSSLAKKGWSQGKIARKLHTRKLNITRLMQKRKIGKRVTSEFWESVRIAAKDREISWSEARSITKTQPYWARKRAKRQGKEYKSYSEFWKEWREKWRDATEAERAEHEYNAVYSDEGGYVGGTPR